jgi:hypothetical protein
VITCDLSAEWTAIAGAAWRDAPRGGPVLLGLLTAARNGACEYTTDTVARLTGHPPGTFEAFLQRMSLRAKEELIRPTRTPTTTPTDTGTPDPLAPPRCGGASSRVLRVRP